MPSDTDHMKSNLQGENVLIPWSHNMGAIGKENRRHYLDLLLEKKGDSLETTIRSLADEIKKSYIAEIKEENVSGEIGNYYSNPTKSLQTPNRRIWSIRRSNIESKTIWNQLARMNCRMLIDLSNECDGNKIDMLLVNISEHGRLLVEASPIKQPISNLELQVVERKNACFSIAHCKYPHFPMGFAPFDLIPAQKMYELSASLKKPNSDVLPIAVISRDADTRCCVFPMIDALFYIMSTSNSLETLHKVGQLMAKLRKRSVDLVTTAQIEFALCVCFKILDDEFSDKGRMLNENTSIFYNDLQKAWASSWLKNAEQFQKYWEENDGQNQNYVESDRNEHWYPASKKMVLKIRESVVSFVNESKKIPPASKVEPKKQEAETEKLIVESTIDIDSL